MRVDLDADPVELPLGGRTAEPLDRRGRVRRAAREHRRERPADLDPQGLERGQAPLQRGRADRRQVAGQQQRAADGRGRNAGGLRDRLDEHARERSLPQLTADQRAQEALLRRGRATEQLPGEPGPLGGRAGARDSLERRERCIHVVQGQRGRLGRRGHGAEPAIADARPPLARLTDEVREPDRRLGFVELHEAVGEPVALGEARGGGCDVLGRRDEVGQQHRAARYPSSSVTDDPSGEMLISKRLPNARTPVQRR